MHLMWKTTLAFSLGLLAAGTRATAGPGCTLELYQHLGERHFPATTSSAEAQRYIDQGMQLAYAFNHEEAARFFEHAASLDEHCAMCYWGLGYVLGPNINRPMGAAEGKRAYAATQKAVSLAAENPALTEREKAYISTLAKRYAPEPGGDRSALDQAYADAMADVAARFPDDHDATALYAEALMDTSPWDYWGAGGVDNDLSRKLRGTLEGLLAIDPTHIGAEHFYIHAVEEFRPKLAEAAADRLLTQVPDAGHLVHMSSHIYFRVGRYDDAAKSNAAGIEADERYLARCTTEPGFYGMMYLPHNYSFYVVASATEGRSADALRVARELSALMQPHLQHPSSDSMLEPQDAAAQLLHAQVRFGRWSEILATQEPADELAWLRGIYHYARTVALARTGSLNAAEKELEALRAAAQDPRLADRTIMGVNKATTILEIGIEEATGVLAAARGDFDAAARHLTEGVARQDALRYMEPPPWPRPMREVLGEVQLCAGNAQAAEVTFRAALDRLSENGWSLSGLARSLEKQGKIAEAKEVWKRFDKAWALSDFTLPRGVSCSL